MIQSAVAVHRHTQHSYTLICKTTDMRGDASWCAPFFVLEKLLLRDNTVGVALRVYWIRIHYLLAFFLSFGWGRRGDCSLFISNFIGSTAVKIIFGGGSRVGGSIFLCDLFR